MIIPFDEMLPALVATQPMVLPVGWRVGERFVNAVVYRHDQSQMTVIAEVKRYADDREWLHVSLSFPDRMPSWETLKSVRDLFVGRERTVLQVLPPAAKYVNKHPYCLHLWCCMDGDVTPDFTEGKGMI